MGHSDPTAHAQVYIEIDVEDIRVAIEAAIIEKRESPWI